MLAIQLFVTYCIYITGPTKGLCSCASLPIAPLLSRFFYPKLTFLGTTKSFESETPVRSISGSQTDKLEQNSEVKRALWAGFYTYACTHTHTVLVCIFSQHCLTFFNFLCSFTRLKCDLHDVTSLIKIWLCIAVLCWLNCCIFFQREKSFYILITHNKFPHCLY